MEVDVADAVVAEALLIGDEQSAAAWRAAEQRVVAAKEREQAAEARAHEAERTAAAMEALLVAELHSVDQDEIEECYNAMLGFEIMYNEEREFSKGCS